MFVAHAMHIRWPCVVCVCLKDMLCVEEQNLDSTGKLKLMLDSGFIMIAIIKKMLSRPYIFVSVSCVK